MWFWSHTNQVSRAAAAGATRNPQVSAAENQTVLLSLSPLPQLRAFVMEAGECQVLGLFLDTIF